MKKIVFITGCSSGMGRAIALKLSKLNFRVYAASRTPNLLPKMENLHPLYMDLKDTDSVKDALNDIERVDILINNAGYGLVTTVEELDENEMMEEFEINLFGTLRVTKFTIPKMRTHGGGVIINISSFLGKIGLPLLTIYNATKYAMEGVTDSLRYELKDFNIRVHSILPGFFDTNFARENLVINKNIDSPSSPYRDLSSKLLPTLIEQINGGNDVKDVVEKVLYIIQNDDAPIKVAAGEKAKKFIPMRRELTDEEFEKRVIDYYGL
jgi:short-subunit dehydrogenase